MADRVLLPAHGLIRLEVFHPLLVVSVPMEGIAAGLELFDEIVRLRAALVDEVLRKVKVLLLARHIVKAAERQLDFLMSGIAMQLALFGSEHREDIVHVLLHHVEETALAGGFIIGDRCFQNMAGAVKLVAVA